MQFFLEARGEDGRRIHRHGKASGRFEGSPLSLQELRGPDAVEEPVEDGGIGRLVGTGGFEPGLRLFPGAFFFVVPVGRRERKKPQPDAVIRRAAYTTGLGCESLEKLVCALDSTDLGRAHDLQTIAGLSDHIGISLSHVLADTELFGLTYGREPAGRILVLYPQENFDHSL